MTGALRAEWTKARSLPSTAWLLLGLAVAMVAIGLAATGSVHVDECGQGACTVDTVKLTLGGVRLAQVAAAVLGVLVVTADYATGTIVPTLAAVPRRWRVVVAKVAVLAAGVAGAAVAGVVGALLVARAVLPGRGFTPARGYAATTVVHDLTQRAAVGTVLYLVLVAVLGAGLGFVIRDTGVAVTVVLALLLLAPVLAMVVGDPVWQTRIHRFAPADAGLAVQATRGLATLPIAPWRGLALLAAYALAALGAGAWTLRVRDAST